MIYITLSFTFVFEQSDSDEEDDMILLTGAGRTFKWRFPIGTVCPVARCGKKFETRTKAIRHYKTKHSMNFQYCSLCAKPVSAHSYSSFKEHISKMHPNDNLQDSDLINADEDDLIQLNGGNQLTEWIFPKSIRRNCPVASCPMSFAVRSDTRNHFKEHHTSDHFYCQQCDKVILAHGQIEFNEHQRKVHSKLLTPIKLENSRETRSTSKV